MRHVGLAKLKVFLVIFILAVFILPADLSAEVQNFWVDTSHWETRPTEYIEQGYWQVTPRKDWVDTSYTVEQGYWEEVEQRRWVDTSYTVSQGYWEDYTYSEWVTSGYYQYYTAQRWVDTSHWETRYRYVDRWVSTNKVFIYGTDSYGWSVYSSYAKYAGYFEGTINGNRYKYHKYVIDYRPSYGGRIYAIKYVCNYVLKSVQESYQVWVSSGYWQSYTDSYYVDTSHWETRTARRWVDTSYTVEQGYWDYYTTKVWVDTSYTVSQGYWHYYSTTDWIDTSYWEYEDIWVEEGYWVEVDINLEGRVLHTLQWDRNRINYNLSKTGTEDNPRAYEIFFNGEKFILNAYATGDFEPDNVHVELLGTEFETDLSKSTGNKWEGYIWDDSFINFHDIACKFKFIAYYENGVEIEDEVTVYIVRDFYWLLHRGF
jgi:hypothetical protein